jgi:hypothetical protein
LTNSLIDLAKNKGATAREIDAILDQEAKSTHRKVKIMVKQENTVIFWIRDLI